MFEAFSMKWEKFIVVKNFRKQKNFTKHVARWAYNNSKALSGKHTMFKFSQICKKQT